MTEISDKYIVAVKKVGENLECFQKLISKPETLIEELKAMVENPNRSVYDLQSKFVNDYKFEDRSWYICFPYSYSASYLNAVKSPKIKSYSELKEGWKQVYDEEIQQCKVDCERCLTAYDEVQASSRAEARVAKIKKTEKENFFKECKRWIDVNELQIQTEILSRQNNILMYSKENIGWSVFNYIISDDLKVSIKTNFGYGSAAYFFLSVKYKDLEIVPYSFIVKYYKAMMADIVRCTRRYDVRRDSWEAAFDFTTEIANQAHCSPESFIREYVMNEVREMMEGLKAIIENPNDMYNNIVKMHCPELVVNVRSIMSNEKDRMRAYPQECMFIFKVEKISGALHFLQSLKQTANTFDGISHEINDCIDTLLNYNFQLYPKIQEQYTKIEARIKHETSVKKSKEIERDMLVEELKPYEARLEAFCKNVSSCSERQARREEFGRQNPIFVTKRERKNTLDIEITIIHNRIVDYGNFNKMLQKSMELIDSVREIA